MRTSFAALALMTLSLNCGSPPPAQSGRCGDQRLDPGETCDDGNGIDDDACTNACTLAACGDGIVRTDLAVGVSGFEACDDGNELDDDGCLADCSEARAAVMGCCARTSPRAKRAMKPAMTATTSPTTSAPTTAPCRSAATARLQPEMGEICDDGNDARHRRVHQRLPPSRLRRRLGLGRQRGVRRRQPRQLRRLPEHLHGGALRRRRSAPRPVEEGEEGYEACDDGNSDSDDACLTTCVAARCGDGIYRRDLNPNHPDYEECDDGNDSDDDECSTDLHLA